VSAARPQEGVFYAKEAHLGAWRRLAVGLVDVIVVLTGTILVGATAFVLLPETPAAMVSIAGLLMLVAIYYVVLKRSDLGTLGYRLFRVRVVNLQGERPSVFQMISRLSFMAFGPLNGVIDLLWIPSDDSRQAIRDRWSQTYVVRTNASPAGSGPIVSRRYEIMGFNLVFEEVAVRGPAVD
jgi:uncharacterized RDD family membrane protein YckC